MPPADLAFIHIGAHKTGTTLLQSVFARHSAGMARGGVIYLPPRALRRAFSVNTPRWRQEGDAAIPAMQAALKSLLPGNQGGHALLISDESLLGHLRTDLGNSPDRLYQHCGEMPVLLKRVMGKQGLVVLLFIRRLDEFLPSAYLQRVRLGETATFEQYLSGLDLVRLSWLPTVNELAATLTGEGDRLIVYDYAALRDAPGALLSDLFGRLGLAAPPASVLRKRVNASLTSNSYRAVMALNRIWPFGRARMLRHVVAAVLDLRLFPGARPARLMDPALAARLAARHGPDLDAIEAIGGNVELVRLRGDDGGQHRAGP